MKECKVQNLRCQIANCTQVINSLKQDLDIVKKIVCKRDGVIEENKRLQQNLKMLKETPLGMMNKRKEYKYRDACTEGWDAKEKDTCIKVRVSLLDNLFFQSPILSHCLSDCFFLNSLLAGKFVVHEK